MMRLLILTNYFTPDVSAGSFRMQALVEALEAWRDQGLDVDVITTRPNRYATLKAEAPDYEDHGWLRVHRVAMPAHKNGMADQARSYLSYARRVRALTREKRWDLVFATSSRLMTAGLGAHVARRIKAPLYLDIRDLFTVNMDELLAGSPLKPLMPVFRWIERDALNAATHINIVSEGFTRHIQTLAPKAPLSVFTNGIDDIFVDTDFIASSGCGDLPLIVYAGNMGEGQGLHHILPDVARRLSGKARFRLIGDGGRRAALEQLVAGLSNVEIVPPVPRTALIEHYRQADILFLHLNDLTAFRKVLPSKVFEYAATGKPMLAGVAGYAAEFLRNHVPDAEVFNPLDAAAMALAVDRLLEGPSWIDRSYFKSTFERKAIMAAMARGVLSLHSPYNPFT